MPARTGRPWRTFKEKALRQLGDQCHLCGRPGADSLDHLVPVSHGGALLDMNNVLPAHSRCNTIRGNRPINVARAELRGKPVETPTGPGFFGPNGQWNRCSRWWTS